MKKTKVGFNIRHITECSHYKSITKYGNWASALLQRWRWKYWSFPETVENTLISPWETAATVHLPTATQVPGYFSIRVWVFSPPCVRNPRVTIIRVHLHSMLLPLTAIFSHYNSKQQSMGGSSFLWLHHIYTKIWKTAPTSHQKESPLHQSVVRGSFSSLSCF